MKPMTSLVTKTKIILFKFRCLQFSLGLSLVAGLMPTLAFSGSQSSRREVVAQQVYARKYLKKFRENPSSAMSSPVPKFNFRGEPVSAQDLHPIDWQLKQQIRSRTMHNSTVLANIDGKNEPQLFFPQSFPIQKKLALVSPVAEELEPSPRPWSGDYWATFKGGIASRYNDPDYPQSWNFMENYNAYLKFQEINFEDQVKLNNLSPSEKYDILMGDEKFSLTRWSFESAYETYKQNNNDIEPWFGICHGWAPASLSLPHPTEVISYQIKNFKGHDFNINFYPDDLKALGSLMWANARFKTYFLGGRCNVKEPEQDENGRVIDPDCFDLNPGSWHLAAIQQMRNNKAGFTFDASFDYEVWNQPILRISWKFFNPQTHVENDQADPVTISMADFSKDVFKKYRSPAAKKIVGVQMSVSYVTESSPIHEYDELNEQNVRDVVYIYDLELNAKGEIIGGEWYQNDHPDFMWAADKQARPWSSEEYSFPEKWDGQSGLPGSWKAQAPRISLKGQPLGHVIEKLFELSHVPQ